MYRLLKFGHIRIVSSTAKWFPEDIKFGTASWSGGTTGSTLQVEEIIIFILNYEKKLKIYILKGTLLAKFKFSTFFKNIDMSKVDITKIDI